MGGVFGLSGKRTLGRPAADADPVHVRYCLRVQAGLWPALEDAGHQGAVSYIELIRGVPLISLLSMSSVMLSRCSWAGRRVHRQASARADRHHHVRRRLPAETAVWLAGDPEGAVQRADSLGLKYWQQMRKIICRRR